MSRRMEPLGAFISEYKEYNTDGSCRPVAVGRYGIRKREDIYSKELAKDYSRNKVIRKDTLTIGMGSKQIDIGILTDDKRYSVSPAYRTFEISGIDGDYLRYCLEGRNSDMSKRFMVASCRQGKTVDVKRMLEYRIPVCPPEEQKSVVVHLDLLDQTIDVANALLERCSQLVKSKFVEMFGDPRSNIHGFAKKTLKDVAMGKLSYGSSCSAVPFDGNMRFIRITDINEEGRLNQDIKSPSIIDEKYLLHDGDILFARTGATVGKTYRYRTSDEKAIYAGYLIRAIPDKSQILPDYLFWFTKTQFYLRFVLNAQKTVAQPNINAQEYGKLELLVPPLSLQEEFARFAEQADKSQFTPVPSAAPLQDCDAFLISIPVNIARYFNKATIASPNIP